MQCVLAVDGGNTKTIALVAALDGTILGAGRGGCGDMYNAPTSTRWPDSATAAIANIEDAIMRALQAAQVESADLVSAVFNMAGLDWPEDFVLLQTTMEERGFGRTISIQNDALGVLHAGSSDNTGVSVVCGTGGATGARGPDGRTWHSSCWQNQVQGSTQLAQKALDAVYRSELGIDPPTTLTPRVLDFFHLPTVEEVLHLLTSRLKQPTINLGYLAPILLDEAQAGDAATRQIVEEHGVALGNYALVAARFVGLEGTAFRLVLAGGVLRHPSPLLADAIIARVRTTSPDVQPIRYRFEPIIGVLFTALEAAEVAINDALLENLIPTIPAPSLFATVLYPS
ncbi:MAG: BadF/BadG/BcrA/BcrD ATPase family protein [Ktedonobacteraceae bacterium]